MWCTPRSSGTQQTIACMASGGGSGEQPPAADTLHGECLRVAQCQPALLVLNTPWHHLNCRQCHRCREFGMWLVDGSEYYAPPGAKWLTYQNTVRQYVDALSKQVGALTDA